MVLVIVLLLIFWTPRITMHMWLYEKEGGGGWWVGMVYLMYWGNSSYTFSLVCLWYEQCSYYYQSINNQLRQSGCSFRKSLHRNVSHLFVLLRGFDDDADARGLSGFSEGMGNLLGESFLNLEPSTVHFYNSCQLTQTQHSFVWKISYGHLDGDESLTGSWVKLEKAV